MTRRTAASRTLSTAVVTNRRRLQRVSALLVAMFGLAFLQFGPGLAQEASATSPLKVFVGYMDTHSGGFSTRQPRPWPYKSPAHFIGSPCPNYPNDIKCWDASAIRLVNPNGRKVTGVRVIVVITSHSYALWGSNDKVGAHSQLVLTETGKQNSANFDLSDFPPNAYNGGNPASCANDHAIPVVEVTFGGTTTMYKDTKQVLNGRGADSGHCVNGKWVPTRVDESHPWVRVLPSAAGPASSFRVPRSPEPGHALKLAGRWPS